MDGLCYAQLPKINSIMHWLSIGNIQIMPNANGRLVPQSKENSVLSSGYGMFARSAVRSLPMNCGHNCYQKDAGWWW
jgi:hypothetical protein